MKHHLKHMIIGGAVVLVALLAFGVDLGRALPYALLLACPLGMFGMMFMMNRQGGHNHAGHDADGKGSSCHEEKPAPGQVAPRTRDDHERIP